MKSKSTHKIAQYDNLIFLVEHNMYSLIEFHREDSRFQKQQLRKVKEGHMKKILIHKLSGVFSPLFHISFHYTATLQNSWNIMY